MINSDTTLPHSLLPTSPLPNAACFVLRFFAVALPPTYRGLTPNTPFTSHSPPFRLVMVWAFNLLLILYFWQALAPARRHLGRFGGWASLFDLSSAIPRPHVNTELNCRHYDTDHVVYILRIVTISAKTQNPKQVSLNPKAQPPQITSPANLLLDTRTRTNQEGWQSFSL